ncbi:MAG: DNA repair protein RecN, partial [Polyangiaceae bacterium]|nr:DNA repair protein RecN [Polyangiaceae bacterium]
PSVCDELRAIVGDLRGAVELDPLLGEALALVESANSSLLEAGRNLQRYAENVQADPARLDAVEERLFTLEKLLRLHGPTEEDAVAARDRILRDLEALEEVDGRVDALREQFAASLRAAGHVARELSEARKQVAGELARAISNELAALSMGGARVEVEVAPHDGARSELEVDGARLTPDGLDRVEFLIAPNKGIAPRPLRKIASGGELSRSLLAIKRVLASKGPAGLYVFDEVDTGVGGAVAERLGQALADIARHRQVLCITHLAPIAALADAHFVVRKTQHGAVATTAIQPVRDSDRVREVARMLSGARISRACLQTAEEMLRSRAAC